MRRRTHPRIVAVVQRYLSEAARFHVELGKLEEMRVSMESWGFLTPSVGPLAVRAAEEAP